MAMDAYKTRSDFAEMQIRCLLRDLDQKSHKDRLRAAKKFQEYIDTYKPEMYDDDVDMLFLGVTDARDDMDGLLVWAGTMSESHKNSQLKRICGPIVSLMKHLILDVDFGQDSNNIFFDRFTRLPIKELKNINFSAHFAQFGTARDKSTLYDLYELITVIVKDHRNSETDTVEPVDVDAILAAPDVAPAAVNACKEGYLAWLHRAATAQIGSTSQGTSTAGGVTTSSSSTSGNSTGSSGSTTADGRRASISNATTTATTNAANEKAEKEKADREYRQWMQARPRAWADVKVKQVPLQPDEEGYGDKEEVKVSMRDLPVADPLGLVKGDLREYDSLNAENADVLTIAERATLLEAKFGKRFAGNNNGPAPRDLLSLMRRIEITGKRQKEQQAQSAAAAAAAATAAAVLSSAAAARNRAGSRAGRSGSDALEDGVLTMASNTPSLLPFEKSFSAASYLSLVHSNATLSELSEGLQNLQVQMDKQSSLRENLVRTNIGLFIDCVDGINWLRTFNPRNNRDLLGAINAAANAGVAVPQNANAMQLQFMAQVASPNAIKRSSGAPEDPKVAAASRPTRLTSDVVSGNAVANLQNAKDNALEILAPILDRMARYRRVRAADAMLKRYAAVLELPHLMAMELEKGDYEEALRVYNKMMTNPMAANLNVREQGKEILVQMRREIVSILFTSGVLQPDTINRLSKILIEIDTPADYRSVLEKCFNDQLSLFMAQYTDISKSCDKHIKKMSASEDAKTGAAGKTPQADAARNRPAPMPAAPTSSPRRKVDVADIRSKLKNAFEDDEDEGLSGSDDDDDDDEDGGGSARPPSAHVKGGGLDSLGRLDERDDENSASESDEEDEGFEKRFGGGARDRALMQQHQATMGERGQAYSFFSLRMRSIRRIQDLIVKWAPSLLAILQLLESSTTTTASASTASSSGDASRGLGANRQLNKGLDVAFGRRYGGASKFANLLGSSLEKFVTLARLLLDGFPEDYSFLLDVREGFDPKTGVSATPRKTDVNKDFFSTDASAGGNSASITPAKAHIRGQLQEPFLSRCVKSLSGLHDHFKRIVQPYIESRGAEEPSPNNILLAWSEERKKAIILSPNSPLYSPFVQLRGVITRGNLAIATRIFGILEEASSRLLLGDTVDMASTDRVDRTGGGGGGGWPEEDEDDAHQDDEADAEGHHDDDREGGDGLRSPGKISKGGVTIEPVRNASKLLESAVRECGDGSNNYARFVDSLSSTAIGSGNSRNIVTAAGTTDTGKRCGRLETMARQLEYMIVQTVRYIHHSLCIPDLIFEYMLSKTKSLLSQFIADLAAADIAVLGPQEENVSTNRSNHIDRRRASESAATNTVALELELIELDLNDDSAVHESQIRVELWFLDQIRAFLALRSSIAQSVHTEIQRLFTAETGLPKGTSSSVYLGGVGILPPSLSATKKPSSTFESDQDPYFIPTYLKGLEFDNDFVGSIVKEVAAVENAVVRKYIDYVMSKLRTSVQTAYSIIVKSELGSTWGLTPRQLLLLQAPGFEAQLQRTNLMKRAGVSFNPGSNFLPSGLSRILFEMAMQRAELSKAFGMMTIAEGLTTQLTAADIMSAQRFNLMGAASTSSAESATPSGAGGGWRDRIERRLSFLGASTMDGLGGSDVGAFDSKQRRGRVRYETFLFSAICVSLLDIYLDVIDSLASNTFSIHSSGREKALATASADAAARQPGAKRGLLQSMSKSAASAAAAAAAAGVTAPIMSASSGRRVLISRAPGAYGSESMYVSSLGRACEEYIFLRNVMDPMLDASPFPQSVVISNNLAIEMGLASRMLSASAAGGTSSAGASGSSGSGATGGAVTDGANTRTYPTSSELVATAKIYVDCFNL